ncbi:MAG: hydrogenase expression/formation protein HypE [Spongiibacteraceae bacterium]
MNDILGKTITLSHGSGGRDMHRLLDHLVLPILCADADADDAARIPLAEFMEQGDNLAYTTDSYTVSPLFFPGGNIGSLAIYGTVNDLAVSGALARYISCSLIIEEGFDIQQLREILQSMRAAADEVGVKIVTGDTKVVHRGAADGLFINTSGIGAIPNKRRTGTQTIQPGDSIIVSGYIGDHGTAVLCARRELHIDAPISSDCKSLQTLCNDLFKAAPHCRMLRDATRGGVATVLNEIASAADVGIRIDENTVPVRASVRGACEILGLEPLHFANEGTLIAVIPAEEEQAALAAMHANPAGENAVCIGHVVATHSGVVAMVTAFGGERVLDLPAGELLPRIC